MFRVMRVEKPHFIYIIEHTIKKRKAHNPLYSLRAFAKQAGVSQGFLSLILSEKRKCPVKHAERLIKVLDLKEIEIQKFMKSVVSSNKKNKLLESKNLTSPYKTLDNNVHSQIISEWEHFAIMSLLDLKHFNPNVSQIHRRLGISLKRAINCVENLKAAGLVSEINGQIKKHCNDLKTTDGIISQAIQKSHLESLQLAKNKLKKVPLPMRDFSSVTFTVNPERIHEIKNILTKLRDDLSDVFETNDATEVYRLNLQLFPLTKLESTL